MPAPSKLTDKQWWDVEKRISEGESMRALAKEYKVTEGTIRHRVNTHLKPMLDVAKQLADAELAKEALSIITQVKIRTLADELKSISVHLTGAARLGAMTSHKLAELANIQVNLIDEENPMASEDAMKSVSALSRMSNDSSQIAISLINANKDQMNKLSNPDEKEVKSINDFYAEHSNAESSVKIILANAST